MNGYKKIESGQIYGKLIQNRTGIKLNLNNSNCNGAWVAK